MKKYESRMEREKRAIQAIEFVEGLECAKKIIINELNDTIQNGAIVITKGSDRLFEIINSIGVPTAVCGRMSDGER